MRYMQVIEARDINQARQSYLQLLQRRGVSLPTSMAVFVETVHRPAEHRASTESWLCYLSNARSAAA
jgi:hypothetical protein